jgi:hypothetical protein
MENIMGWIAGVVALLFAISEFLGMFDKIKANGVFQAIKNGLKSVMEFLSKK